MRGLLAIALALAAALVGASADACNAKNAIMTQPLAWTGGGASILVERLVLPPRVSVVGIAGLRGGALGDYASTTVALGAEARMWLRSSAGRGCAHAGMSGAVLGLRLVGGHTTLTDELTGRSVGSSLALDPTLTFGYRFAVLDRIEITPYLGAGARIDVDGGGHLVAWARPTLGFGFTVGWLF